MCISITLVAKGIFFFLERQFLKQVIFCASCISLIKKLKCHLASLMVNAEDVNMADLGDRARSSGAR